MNIKQYEMLKRSVSEWNEWRQNNLSITPDLTRANLRDANLGGADLRDANLGWANLGGANLRDANLGRANLRDEDLTRADLRDANLTDANLGGANLRDANLGGADLRDANLGWANLGGANLRDANLGGADLRDANLGGADLTNTRLPYFQICPEVGSFTAYKKLGNNTICELLIPAEAKRNSCLTGRKCRAEFARVISGSGESKYSNYGSVSYIEGDLVYPDMYDDDIRVECSHGIHFFVTRKEAEDF